MAKEEIYSRKAPQAIGIYSQAIRVGQTIFISGQIPLDFATMKVVKGSLLEQIHIVFQNLASIMQESGGNLDHVVKLTVFLTDLDNFNLVNEVMAEHFKPPYPARAVVGVVALPKGVPIEIDAVACLAE